MGNTPPPPPPSRSETRITTDPAAQEQPRINGDTIVWTDWRNGGGNRDVYSYDLTTNTERQITTNPYDQFFPHVQGNRVVYTGRSTASSPPHIYLYDLSTNTNTLLTNSSYMQTMPFVSGDQVAYADNRAGGWDVRLLNIGTGADQALTTNHASDPHMLSDTYLAWMRGTGGIYKTFSHNLQAGATAQITSPNSDQMYPYVSGTKIVYSGRASAGSSAWDIYLYDILTGTETKLSSQSSV